MAEEVSNCEETFYERVSSIVNGDSLAIRAGISVSADKVAGAARQLGLKLEGGRIMASDVFRLCSRIAWELDNRGESCRGFRMCRVLENIINKNREMIVEE